MTRCSAITKAGKQCSVTSLSNWRDDHGRLVAEPLQKGGECCLLHAKPFCTKAVQVDDVDGEGLLIIMLDLETTGIDIAKDRIVEIAAVHYTKHKALGANPETDPIFVAFVDLR